MKEDEDSKSHASKVSKDFDSLGKLKDSIMEPKKSGKDEKARSGHAEDDVCITQIKYIREIGLLASSFDGTVKFFDPFYLRLSFSTSNATRTEEFHTNITTFSISEKLSILATGGVEGKVMIIDPYAQGIVKAIKAHPDAEVLSVHIYEEQ